MQRVLANEFSWSKSRHEKFSDCRRAYYLSYYGSWGGWEEKASSEVRELYLLKKLSNRYTWAGNAAHEAIRDVLLDLQAGRPVEAASVLERVRRQMREDYRHSHTLLFRTRKLRKTFAGLVEHEYAEPVAAEEWKRTWDSVEQALLWFFQSRWMEVARALKRHEWLEVDEGAFHSNLELQGIRFFAVPDFAYREPSGDVVVVDWKTGKAREGYEEQVTGYALYLSKRYRVGMESIRAALVYLNEGTEVEVRISPDALVRFEESFQASVEAMRALLEHPEKNRPKPLEAFPMTEDVASCLRCVFRRVCARLDPTRHPS